MRVDFVLIGFIDSQGMSPAEFCSQTIMSTYESKFAQDEVEESQRQDIAMRMGYLTERQFGTLAKITASTLETWRRTGRGPSYTRLGNAVFYALDEVRYYLVLSKKKVGTSRIQAGTAQIQSINKGGY